VRVVLPWRRPGVTATNCEPFHWAFEAVRSSLSVLLLRLGSPPEFDDGGAPPAAGALEDVGGVEVGAAELELPEAPGVLFFMVGPDEGVLPAVYCAMTRPASFVTVAEVAV